MVTLLKMNKILPMSIALVISITALFSFSDIRAVYRASYAGGSYPTPSMQAAGRNDPIQLTPLNHIPAPLICAVVQQMTKGDEGSTLHSSDPLPTVVSKAVLAELISRSGPTLRTLIPSTLLSIAMRSADIVHAALEFYLNHVQLTPHVWGVAEAASLYFSKPLVELTAEEAFLLGVVVVSPPAIDLRTSSPVIRDELIRSVTEILNRMRLSGILDETDVSILSKRTQLLIAKLTGISSSRVDSEEVLSSGYKAFSSHQPRYVVGACRPSAARTHQLMLKTMSNDLHIEAEPDPVDALPLRQALTTTADHIAPEFLSISPDQRFLLLKRPMPHHVDLVVLDREHQRTIASQSFGLKAFNPVWHPKEHKLALALRTERDRYVLTIWDISKNTTKNVLDFASFSPPNTIWSPDGQMLAYSSTPKADAPTEQLSVVSILGTHQRLIGNVKREASVSWEGDARSLVYIAANSPGSVTQVPLDPKENPRTFEIVQGECEGIATRIAPPYTSPTKAQPDFERSVDLAISCKKNDAEFYNLFLVTLSKSRVTPLPTDVFSHNGDLIHPRWHPNGQELFFQHREGTQSNLVLLRNALEISHSTPEFIPFPTEGTSTLLEAQVDKAIVRWSDLSHPPQVVSWDVNQGVTKLVERSSLPSWITPSHLTKIPLPTSDGHTVMTYHWHAKPTTCFPAASTLSSQDKPAKRGVLIVTSGSGPQVPDTWSVAQEILSNFGVEVVSLHYRGAKERGAAFENTTEAHTARLQDILTVWRYMTNTLKMPPENISVVGLGYGAQLTIDLVSRELAGIRANPRGIVLVSPSIAIQDPKIPAKFVAYKGTVSVFRGGWDLTNEQTIRKYIGSRLLSVGTGNSQGASPSAAPFKWTILFKEGAGLHTTTSLVEILKSVLLASGVSPMFSPYRTC